MDCSLLLDTRQRYLKVTHPAICFCLWALSQPMEPSGFVFFLPLLIRANRCQCSPTNKGFCCWGCAVQEHPCLRGGGGKGWGESIAENSVGVLGEAGEALTAKNIQPSIFKNTFEGSYKHTGFCWQNKAAHLCCVLSLKTRTVCVGSPKTTLALWRCHNDPNNKWDRGHVSKIAG